MIYGLNITFKNKIMSSEFINKKIEKYAFTAETTVAIVSTTTPISPVTGAVSTITKAAHGLKTGDVVSVVTGTVLPTGLSADTAYYVYKVNDSSFKLATTWALAIAGTPDVAITDQGTGTQTFRKNGIGICHTGIMIPDDALATSLVTNATTAFTSTGGGGSTKISVAFGGLTPISAVAFDHATLTGVDQWISTTPLYTTSEAELLITVATNALAGGVCDIWVEYNI